MDLFKQWPLTEFLFSPESTTAFKGSLGYALPLGADESILESGKGDGKQVVILWEYDAFVVLEELEGLTDEEIVEEYGDADVSRGNAYRQVFEVILMRDFLYPDSQEVESWLDDIALHATAKAEEFRKEAGYEDIYVLEDGRSALPSSAVVFSVGPVDREVAQRNRDFVASWVTTQFPQILAAAPVLEEDMDRKSSNQNRSDNSRRLLFDSELAIRALREYIQALPDDVVAALPAMPGIDGDWLDELQADLRTAIAD